MQPGSFIITMILIIHSAAIFSQSAKSQAELARLQTAVDNAKNRVALNQKKIVAADSVIEAGRKIIDEAKAEIKMIDSESKRFEKEFAARYKPVKKLTGSKDKAAARKAASDLRAMDTEHRKTNDSFVARMNNAYRKQMNGVSAINRGRNSKISSRESLDAAAKALKIAQKKYDSAAATGKK